MGTDAGSIHKLQLSDIKYSNKAPLSSKISIEKDLNVNDRERLYTDVAAFPSFVNKLRDNNDDRPNFGPLFNTH